MKLNPFSLAIALLSTLLVSCAYTQVAGPPPSAELELFGAAPEDNPWNQKIENWQERHDRDIESLKPDASSGSELAGEYRRFTLQLREHLAGETVRWVQARSQKYYRPDGERDHWATLGEVIEAGGDDCDGLDLLTFVLLRRLGFGADEIYRAIVVEEGTAQHHMVTLWFPGGVRGDPFVLDPTGVVSAEMVRLSAIDSWKPIELFDEDDHFAVEERLVSAEVSAE